MQCWRSCLPEKHRRNPCTLIAPERTDIVHNDERSNRRFAVASTFKILHSLIALEEKVATGKDHVIRWNGKRHEFSDWNRDQTLGARSGFHASGTIRSLPAGQERRSTATG